MAIINFDGTPNAAFGQRVCSNQLRASLDAKEMLDHLVAVRGDPALPNWAAVAADLGCTLADAPNLFAAFDQLNAAAVTAYNATIAFYGKLQA